MKILTVGKGHGSQDSGKGKPRRVATEDAGLVQNVRTSHGTHHIRSFLVNSKAPSRASLDMIVAHQRAKALPAQDKPDLDDDASPVLRGAAHETIPAAHARDSCASAIMLFWLHLCMDLSSAGRHVACCSNAGVILCGLIHFDLDRRRKIA